MDALSRSVMEDEAARAQEEKVANPAISLLDKDGEMKTLAQIEQEVIMFALQFEGPTPNMSEVARKLGIGRSTLYHKFKDMDSPPVSGRKKGTP